MWALSGDTAATQGHAATGQLILCTAACLVTTLVILLVCTDVFLAQYIFGAYFPNRFYFCQSKPSSLIPSYLRTSHQFPQILHPFSDASDSEKYTSKMTF